MTRERLSLPTLIQALLATLLCAALALPLPRTIESAAINTLTISVNSNGDAPDANPGDGSCATTGGVCTVRAAIMESNASAGRDTIVISGTSTMPLTQLPSLTDPAGTIIRGGPSVAVLDGLVAPAGTDGLKLESDNNIIQGLIIYNFRGLGINIWWGNNNLIGTDGDGSNDAAERNLISSNGYCGISIFGGNNRVAGNYIGTNSTGTAALPNQNGVCVQGVATGNVIGTNGDGQGDAVEGNLISGNSGFGIALDNAPGTIVAGNRIGTDASGTLALPNRRGIGVSQLSGGSRIGTDGNGVSDTAERNVISGNTDEGILLTILDDGVTIAGNYIGTTISGTSTLGNEYGIWVEDSPGNLIGTNGDGNGDAAERNLISGNRRDGILILSSYTSDDTNRIAGNYIGTGVSGAYAIPNLGIGIALVSSGNIVGTNGDGNGDAVEGNLISANNFSGISIDIVAENNIIAGNWIGLNSAGTDMLGNKRAGIWVAGHNNRVGTNGDGISDGYERNIISANEQSGVLIQGYSGVRPTGNIIAGNTIGLNALGDQALPNALDGIVLYEADNNTIGSNLDDQGDSAEGNIIAGNDGYGIFILSGNDNLIRANFIGVDSSGDSFGNQSYGVSIEGTSTGNQIGGTTAGSGNHIAYNYGHGVSVVGANSIRNSILRNSIHNNYELGINLSGSGVDDNDPGDGDTGPNGIQNYPVLDSAYYDGGTFSVGGTLNSKGNKTYRLEFFANQSCDGSDHGEGEVFLGSLQVTTNQAGDAQFTTSFGSVPFGAGPHITATATDPDGSTSEFSACRTTSDPPAWKTFIPLLKR